MGFHAHSPPHGLGDGLELEKPPEVLKALPMECDADSTTDALHSYRQQATPAIGRPVPSPMWDSHIRIESDEQSVCQQRSCEESPDILQ